MQWIIVRNNKAGNLEAYRHEQECNKKKEPFIVCILRRKYCSIIWHYESIWPIKEMGDDLMGEVCKIVDKFSLSYSTTSPSRGSIGKVKIEKAEEVMYLLYLFLKKNIEPVFPTKNP